MFSNTIIDAPFVDRANHIFQWARWNGKLPHRILFNKQIWELTRPRGSIYYTPAKQQWLPGVTLHPEINFELIDCPRYEPLC